MWDYQKILKSETLIYLLKFLLKNKININFNFFFLSVEYVEVQRSNINSIILFFSCANLCAVVDTWGNKRSDNDVRDTTNRGRQKKNVNKNKNSELSYIL